MAPESVDLAYLGPPFFTGEVQKGTMKRAFDVLSIDNPRESSYGI